VYNIHDKWEFCLKIPNNKPFFFKLRFGSIGTETTYYIDRMTANDKENIHLQSKIQKKYLTNIYIFYYLYTMHNISSRKIDTLVGVSLLTFTPINTIIAPLHVRTRRHCHGAQNYYYPPWYKSIIIIIIITIIKAGILI
jgi:hypothetical protein